MSVDDDLIPNPPVVRERLARNLREARFLRRLLRLSVARAEDRHREMAQQSHHEVSGREVGR